MKSQGITSKNFGTKLGATTRSAKTLRANIQNLILFGMEHYASTGDTVYLTKCMQACVGVAALPTQKMKIYIQDHANVSWREIEIKKGKDAGKKTAVFKAKGKEHTYKEPVENWWEYSTAGDVKPDLDIPTAIGNLIKRIEKAEAEHKVKQSKSVANKALAELEAVRQHFAQ